MEAFKVLKSALNIIYKHLKCRIAWKLRLKNIEFCAKVMKTFIKVAIICLSSCLLLLNVSIFELNALKKCSYVKKFNKATLSFV